MADVFEPRADLETSRERLWTLIGETPDLTWQILTKRPEHVRSMVPIAWLEEWPSHVWLGVTCEDQKRADLRNQKLAEIGEDTGAVTFISYEPALERIQIRGAWPDWLIVGGESGPGARPFNSEWAAEMIGLGSIHGTAVFVKQMGSVWAKINRLRNHRGADPAEWPVALRVQEFPTVTGGGRVPSRPIVPSSETQPGAATGEGLPLLRMGPDTRYKRWRDAEARCSAGECPPEALAVVEEEQALFDHQADIVRTEVAAAYERAARMLDERARELSFDQLMTHPSARADEVRSCAIMLRKAVRTTPPASLVVRLAEAEGMLRDMIRPSTTVEEAFDIMDRAVDFLTPSGEAAERGSKAAADLREGNPGDVPDATGGEVSASPDRALDQRDGLANRYHQTLGAKWMCEAVVRWCRTELRFNRNAQAFADDVERRWAEEAFWRPGAPR